MRQVAEIEIAASIHGGAAGRREIRPGRHVAAQLGRGKRRIIQPARLDGRPGAARRPVVEPAAVRAHLQGIGVHHQGAAAGPPQHRPLDQDRPPPARGRILVERAAGYSGAKVEHDDAGPPRVGQVGQGPVKADVVDVAFGEGHAGAEGIDPIDAAGGEVDPNRLGRVRQGLPSEGRRAAVDHPQPAARIAMEGVHVDEFPGRILSRLPAVPGRVRIWPERSPGPDPGHRGGR